MGCGEMGWQDVSNLARDSAKLICQERELLEAVSISWSAFGQALSDVYVSKIAEFGAQASASTAGLPIFYLSKLSCRCRGVPDEVNL